MKRKIAFKGDFFCVGVGAQSASLEDGAKRLQFRV